MPVPYLHVRARGTYREIGRQIGEAAADQIGAAVAFYREHFPRMAGMTFADAERGAAEYLPHALRALPQYVDELKGLGEGSGRSLAELLVLNCAEEFVCATDADLRVSPSERPGAPA